MRVGPFKSGAQFRTTIGLVCVNIMFILTTQVGFLLLISYGKGRSLVSVLFAFFPPNSCCRGLKVIGFKVGMIKQIPSH